MRHHLAGTARALRSLLKAGSGRPLAVLLLLCLSFANLCSEWPPDIGRPALVDAIERHTPETFRMARQLLFDQYQRRFPRIPKSDPVTVVDIDERTLAALGQWPWPRTRLAALIDAIETRGPLAIGIDIYMPEADQTSPDKVAADLPASAARLAAALRALPSHEAILARSLRAAPTVLGAAAFDHPDASVSDDMRSAPVLMRGSNPLPFLQHFDYVLASLPELQAAARGQAILNVTLQQGVVRRMPLAIALRDKVVPGLPVEMLRVATASPAVEIDASATGVQALKVADANVPTQPDGEIWLHFASVRTTRNRYVSAVDVLSGKVDPARLHNRLVLLGLTGLGLVDVRTTALGEVVPGIEIQAQALEMIFDGQFLRRPTWLKWTESTFTFFTGLALIWYMPRSGSRLSSLMRLMPKASAVLLPLNMLTLGAGLLCFRFFGLLLDASSIFIILSAITGCFFSTALITAPEKRHADCRPSPSEPDQRP